MKTTHILCLFSLVGMMVGPLVAQSENGTNAVTLKNGQVYWLQAGRRELLADDLKLSPEVVVSPNGTFTAGKGNERHLGEGQLLRSDGWLLNPDGSAQPVFDHVTMGEGRVLVVRDGKAAPIEKQLEFPNHLVIAPDGMCNYPSGNRSRLVDGQIFRMDGTPVPAKDTVTLKGGRVVVQKDGKLITLAPIQIMGMQDGTRVHGDGALEKRDGTTTRLHEGQTILIDGALIER